VVDFARRVPKSREYGSQGKRNKPSLLTSWADIGYPPFLMPDINIDAMMREFRAELAALLAKYHLHTAVGADPDDLAELLTNLLAAVKPLFNNRS
jgi:hypothetical protein